MRAEKSVSDETLQRMWSEIAILRQKVEQAERKKARIRLRSAIATAQRRLHPRSKRSPSRSSCF
jgi:phage shock protein A